MTFPTYGTTYLPEAAWGGHAYFDSRFQGFPWESVVIAKARQTKWLGLWWLVPADCRQDAEFKLEVGVGDNSERPLVIHLPTAPRHLKQHHHPGPTSSYTREGTFHIFL